MANGHEVKVTVEGRGVLEVEEDMKKNNEENRAGPEEIQVRAFRCGVQKESPRGSFTQGGQKRRRGQEKHFSTRPKIATYLISGSYDPRCGSSRNE
jgi:hypothetical protein